MNFIGKIEAYQLHNLLHRTIIAILQNFFT